jgi:hypothetical protein
MSYNPDSVWRRSARPMSIAFAMALAGCAPQATELGQKQEAVPAVLPAAAETPVCRPSPALLVPQSAPDCAFKRSHLRTIDPGQWSRLKVVYEADCYQRAEKAVRERLRLLQAATKCEIQSARR